MTAQRQRAVWGLGLLVYLIGGLFFFLTPIFQPFVGAIVLLACASATAEAPNDDVMVMKAALVEIVIAVMLALTMSERPAWLEPILFGGYLLGVSLPLIVILYRIWRPRT
jgi:hypothetical protein